MKTLSSVKCGIKGLEEVLNRIVLGVNARTVVQGAGLTVNESDSGVVISLAAHDDDQGQANTTAGGGGGSPSPTYSAITINGVQWSDVTIIDPASCAQSTLTVLAKGAGSVTLDITLS
jgi:hypothetical protein